MATMKHTVAFIAGLVVALVLLPVGAWATVTGTQMFLTDATTGKQAVVDNIGYVMTRVANIASPHKFARRHTRLTTNDAPIATAGGRHTLVVNDVHIDWRAQNPAADQFVTLFVG